MDYETYQVFKEKIFEDICQRCGNCCGLRDDPCLNLTLKDDGTYLCAVYENRSGRQKTCSGKFFECVPIRKILYENWPRNWDCAYKKRLKEV
ncbi:MAG: hypothetical protein ABIG64_05240 [Candidatus Omnitrophota bacterium]